MSVETLLREIVDAWGMAWGEDSAVRAARATWTCIAEPGDGAAGALLARVDPREALELAKDAARIAAATDLDPRFAREAVARWRPRMTSRPVHDAVSRARTSGAVLLTPEDAHWPDAVNDLGVHAPLALWVRGDATALSRPAVAIVGARSATGYGKLAAAELAAGVAAAGIAVVSGAAFGIDGAAHRACLAAGGITVAVLAGGCDRPYPGGHDDLLRRIVATGAVVSEVPCGAAPLKWRFLQRNRVIAALAAATVVVEAGARSGSLNTAGHAASLGRPIGAVPGPITSAASIGCHRLLREYDAVCVTDAAEVRELAGFGDAPTMLGTGARTDDETRLRDALSARVARGVLELSERSGLAPAEVEALLGLLQLSDSVVSDQDGGWRRRSGRTLAS